MGEDNVTRLLDDVADACLRCGRDPASVTVLAATKTVSAARIAEVLGARIGIIGENRVQEFTEKYPVLKDKYRMDLIGSLQTNKARQIVGKAALIHSLDRIELARELEKRAENEGIIQNVLIEVNAGREPNKSGVFPETLSAFSGELRGYPHLCVQGLMCVFPVAAGEALYEAAGILFEDFRSRFGTPILSMGMSSDYRTAIRYGATIIRPGKALFGERVY